MDPNNEPPKIIFENEDFRRPVQSFQSKTPKIIDWVIEHSGGYIKDENQAGYVLVGFVILAIVMGFIFLFSSGGSKAEIKAPLGQKVIYSPNAPPRLEKQF